MTQGIIIQIHIPTEYALKDADSEHVRNTIAGLFPHDPQLENVKKAGGSVKIDVWGAQPAEQPQATSTATPSQPTTATPT